MAGTIKELRQQNKAKRQLRRANRRGNGYNTSELFIPENIDFSVNYETPDFSPERLPVAEFNPVNLDLGNTARVVRPIVQTPTTSGSGRTPTTYNASDIAQQIENAGDIYRTQYQNVVNQKHVASSRQQQARKNAIKKQARKTVGGLSNDRALKDFEWGAAAARAAQGGRQNTNVVAYPNYGQSVNAADVTPNDMDLRRATLYRRQGGKFPVFRNGGIIGLI